MTGYYAITATINGGYQLPTFYLHENVQGILNEKDAERIAYNVIDPGRVHHDVHICAVKI